ncbi:hypothetical protein [Lysinibacillus xylanilyticus]|uniref:hypothetical protein n=1 Tax=Lysinibacillus xylanilyticus TaxID=582475 RepID=UPI0036DA9E99
MSLLANLLKAGATVVKDIELYKDRPEEEGYMWSGGAVLDYKDVRYYFGMWTHFKEERAMTREESIEFFTIRAVEVKKTEEEIKEENDFSFGIMGSDTSYFERDWHLFCNDTIVFLLRQGWFGLSDDEPIKRFIEDRSMLVRSGLAYGLTDKEFLEFENHGFELLVNLSQVEVL